MRLKKSNTLELPLPFAETLDANTNQAVRLLTVALLCLLVIGPAVAALRAEQRRDLSSHPAQNEKLSAAVTARVIAEGPKIYDVMISSDGGFVAYTVVRGSVENNDYTAQLWVVGVSSSRYTGRLIYECHNAGSEPDPAIMPQWIPYSRSLSFFAKQPSGLRALVKFDLDGNKTSVIPIKELPAPGRSGEKTSHLQIKSVGNDYWWSPQGHYLAFTALLGSGDGLDPRKGIPRSTKEGSYQTSPLNGLFVLELSTGAVSQLSPESMNVTGPGTEGRHFDWSPNEREVVVSASPDSEGVAQLRADLFVIDRDTGVSRKLVDLIGSDFAPRWSPNGKWIVFGSQFGARHYRITGSLGLIRPTGGEIIRLSQAGDPRLSPFSGEMIWAPDSKAVYFKSLDQMCDRLLRIDVASRRVQYVFDEPFPCDHSISFAQDGRMAFARESLVKPAEVFVWDSDTDSPRQITHIGEDFPFASRVRTETLSWKSNDGKFDIHGLLLTPILPGKDFDNVKPSAALPTVVCIYGGPSMVRQQFNGDGMNGIAMEFVARGYAVLIPNTRGRGGYGDDFTNGIREGHSYGRLPFEDVMTGVDLLVRRGVADPNRLGIFGFSYGAYLAAYAIEHTDRFKAVVVQESHLVEWFSKSMSAGLDTDWSLNMRENYGIENPDDPVERARFLDESPGMNGMRIKTPTLLLYGAKSFANDVGRPMLAMLERYHVPAELFVYDEGHSFHRPAAIADYLTRSSEWIDQWLQADAGKSSAGK